MSRSGYSDDCENLELWRQAVARAANGKRGQAFFRDLVVALDAIPDKRLAAEELETADGDVCALGALGRLRGMPTLAMDTENYPALGRAFNIAPALAQEVMYENDDNSPGGDVKRWEHMRAWAAAHIKDAPK